MFYFTTAIILIIKEMGWFWNLKKLIHPKNFYSARKPYDCFLCLSFWGNTILLLILLIFNYNTMHFTNYGIVILLTKLIDLQWNKN